MKKGCTEDPASGVCGANERVKGEGTRSQPTARERARWYHGMGFMYTHAARQARAEGTGNMMCERARGTGLAPSTVEQNADAAMRFDCACGCAQQKNAQGAGVRDADKK